MRTVGPPLLPIFRSRHQGELLTALFLQPETEHTLTELAERFELSKSTLHLEVHRLTDAGLIIGRDVGRSRLLRANVEHPASRALTELLMLTFGPQVVVAEEFAGIDGADGVVIFGSWAARYQGVSGPPPNDLDILVVGSPDRAEVYEAADRTQQRLRMPVNPVIRSRSRWNEGADPLIQQVRTSPLVIAFGDLNPDDE